MYFPVEDSPSDVVGKPIPETVPPLIMESERVAALEQALSELQIGDAQTQEKLDLLISQLLRPTRPPSPLKCDTPSPPPSSIRQPLVTRGPPPALPNEFDGDRTKGMAFLRSCQTYFRLCPDSFSDDQMKILWALSYMKSGRAAKWTARIFRWEEENHRMRRFEHRHCGYQPP